MAVADRYLLFGGRLTELSHSSHIEGGCQAASIGAGLAMDQHGLLGTFESSDEVCCLCMRELASGRHAEIDMGDTELLRFGDLGVVPGRACALSAQIDDRLDAVGLPVMGNVGRRRLSRPVKRTRSHNMKVAGELKRPEICPAAESQGQDDTADRPAQLPGATGFPDACAHVAFRRLASRTTVSTSIARHPRRSTPPPSNGSTRSATTRPATIATSARVVVVSRASARNMPSSSLATSAMMLIAQYPP